MSEGGSPSRPRAAAELVAAYREQSWWGTDTLRDVLKRHAIERPDKVAIVEGDWHMSWMEYDRLSDHFAGLLLASGLQSDDTVAVMAPDGPLVHVLFVAAEKAGLVVMAIGPRAGWREIEHLVRVSGARTLVTVDGHRTDELCRLVPDLRSSIPSYAHHLVVTRDGGATLDDEPLEGPSGDELAARLDGRGVGPDELFLLNSTSGTTGLPKCVMHTQNRWVYFHRLAVEAAQLSSDDVFMSIVPAPFGFGIWTSHVTPLLLGATTVVLERFSPSTTITAIEQHQVSVLAAVSTQFIMMLNRPELDEHDLGSLRVLFTGGEAVPRQRAAEFEARTGALVLQFYGSNETGALSRTMLTDSEMGRLETAGRIIDEMHVRLLDEQGRDVTSSGGPGQPACKGPATCLGYYDDDEANRKLFTSDGWMLTGDIATIDTDDYLRVIGRTSDIIIRGGKNISAPAIEGEVLAHPDVDLAAAVAVPDETYGERVCIVISSSATTPPTLEDITAHLEDRGVTKEWWPEFLLTLDEIPRASGGKIAKSELRELAKQHFGRG